MEVSLVLTSFFEGPDSVPGRFSLCRTEGGSIPWLRDRCSWVTSRCAEHNSRRLEVRCSRPPFRSAFRRTPKAWRRPSCWGRGRKRTGTRASPGNFKKRVGQDLGAFISKSHLKRNLLRIQNGSGCSSRHIRKDWERLELGVGAQNPGNGVGGSLVAVAVSFTHWKPRLSAHVYGLLVCTVYADRGMKGKELGLLTPKLSARVQPPARLDPGLRRRRSWIPPGSQPFQESPA